MEHNMHPQYESLLEAYSNLKFELGELLGQLNYLNLENDRLRTLCKMNVPGQSNGALSRDQELQAMRRELVRLQFLLQQSKAA